MDDFYSWFIKIDKILLLFLSDILKSLSVQLTCAEESVVPIEDNHWVFKKFQNKDEFLKQNCRTKNDHFRLILRVKSLLFLFSVNFLSWNAERISPQVL